MTAAGSRRRRRDLLLLAVLGALLFLPGLGARDLWNPDEARYGQVAREMWQGGEWLVPRLNGEVYSEKPPLLFWSIVAISLPRGELTETTVRLPVALAAIAALLLVYRLGERFFGRRAGWLAAAAFATCSKVLWHGRFAQIDMLLTALVAAAVWFWARGYTEGRPRLYPLFFLFAGLATLAKGPVGLLPPLLSIVVFLLLTRDREELRRLRIGRGLLLWAAVVLAWLVPAALEAGRGYLDTMVLRQNLTRYAEPWHHYQPWYYYLAVLPVEFFPWSFLLPTALVVGWRRLVWGGGRDVAGDGAAERARRGFLFALSWVAVTLVFFSLSPAKRTVYVLTLYPALALLVGSALDRLAAAWQRRGDGGPSRGWLLWPLGLLAALLAAAAAALPPVAGRRPELAVLGEDFLWVLEGVVAALAVAAAVACVLAWRRRPAAAAAALAAGMAVLITAASLHLLPAFDAFKSARTLSTELREHLAPGQEFGVFPRLDNTFLFYTGHRAVPMSTAAEVRAFVARPGRDWLVAERDDWRRLDPPPPLVEVARDHDPREGYLLLTEPAPAR
jgi:4-amino-4-deoxy-L-arabinose transferase-like glycosyltransferase